MRTALIVPALLLLAVSPGGARQSAGAPETFTANIQALGAKGGAAAGTIEIDIRRYTPDADRTAVETALKTGGYAAFLTALRKAPERGSVSMAEKKWAIRGAREQPSGKYDRRIVVVTDQPMFFVGGGAADGKPRRGTEARGLEKTGDNGAR